MTENEYIEPDCTIQYDESEEPEPTDMVPVWVRLDDSTVKSVSRLVIPDWDDWSGMPYFDGDVADVTTRLKDGDYPGSCMMGDSPESVDCAVFIRNAGQVVIVWIDANFAHLAR